tara:strand:+ start:139 stop:357 length:219 start_codon:yes stop_codon:yes gene_type:complete
MTKEKAIKMYGSMYEYHKDSYFDVWAHEISLKTHEENAHDYAVLVMSEYTDEEYFKTFHYNDQINDRTAGTV